MKYYDGAEFIRMVQLFCTLTYPILMLGSLSMLIDPSFLGSNDASTSLKSGGRIVRSRKTYYMESNQVTSGSTK
jgi:hypothetical protein